MPIVLQWQRMGWLRSIFPQRQRQQAPIPVEPPQNPNELLRILLVEKLHAEVELERAKAESALRLLKEKEELKVVRREAARIRNKTLKRDSRGYLMKASATDCRICLGAIDFNEEELTQHRSHARNGSTVKPITQ